MRALVLCSLLFLYSCTNSAKTFSEDTLSRRSAAVKIIHEAIERQHCKNVIGLYNPLTQCNENYVLDRSLYNYKVDTLAQVRFWRQIMNLPEDSALINFGHSREIIARVGTNDWNSRSEVWKKQWRDSVRQARCADTAARILFTTGKSFFYNFDRTSQNFQRGINGFMNNNVDPWYAQAILLIESPNKLQKSNVGAYGPFQLMKDVAKMYGLKVNKHVDERADFDRSAYAASSLIKNVCIPHAYKMLDSLKITHYNEEELWFRLLVMHIYHAGAYNVRKALFTLQPTQGNMALIYNLWQTSTARFKSASQNYSQLVLAAMLEMDERSKAVTLLTRAE